MIPGRSILLLLVIATSSHRAGFEDQLQARGLDLVTIARQGRWLALDAEATLAEFMVEGWPDAKSFATVIGGVLDCLARSRICDRSRESVTL